MAAGVRSSRSGIFRELRNRVKSLNGIGAADIWRESNTDLHEEASKD